MRNKQIDLDQDHVPIVIHDSVRNQYHIPRRPCHSDPTRNWRPSETCSALCWCWSHLYESWRPGC